MNVDLYECLLARHPECDQDAIQYYVDVVQKFFRVRNELRWLGKGCTYLCDIGTDKILRFSIEYHSRPWLYSQSTYSYYHSMHQVEDLSVEDIFDADDYFDLYNFLLSKLKTEVPQAKIDLNHKQVKTITYGTDCFQYDPKENHVWVVTPQYSWRKPEDRRYRSFELPDQGKCLLEKVMKAFESYQYYLRDQKLGDLMLFVAGLERDGYIK